MLQDNDEAETEGAPQGKAAARDRCERPCRDGGLRHFWILSVLAWRLLALRSDSLRFLGPTHQGYQSCRQSSLRDYRGANLPQAIPGTSLSQKQPHKRAATSLCQLAVSLAARGRTGCARNRAHRQGPKCRPSHYPVRSPRPEDTRAQAGQTSLRSLSLFEKWLRIRHKSDDCTQDSSRSARGSRGENPRLPSEDPRRLWCACERLRSSPGPTRRRR